MYFVGNCYICCLFLKIFIRGKIIYIPHEIGNKGLPIKHYVLRVDDGVWHFKRKVNFLPKPFAQYFYFGRIEKIIFNKNQETF